MAVNTNITYFNFVLRVDMVFQPTDHTRQRLLLTTETSYLATKQSPLEG